MTAARVGRSLATVVGLLLILVLTLAVFGLPVVESVKLITGGAFGDKFGLSRTAVKATPLLLAGLGMVLAWRAGVYNIGGEGQFIVGGLAGCWLAKAFFLAGDPSPIVATTVILLGSVLGGGVWALIAGLLFVKRGVEVVISTILLNFVALQLLSWAVSGPLKEGKGQLPLTDQLPEALMLGRFDRQTDLHTGVFIALIAAIVVQVFLFRMVPGFLVRLVGASPSAARSNRIPAKGYQVLAIVLSGSLCGLAGGVEYVGVAGQLGTSFAQGWGFLAIPVALLGALHPLLVILSAVYFGALFAGSEHLARFTTAGTTLIYVIQAAAVLGLVALRALAERRPLKTEPA